MTAEEFLQQYKRKKNPHLVNFVSSFTESEVTELMKTWEAYKEDKMPKECEHNFQPDKMALNAVTCTKCGEFRVNLS